MVENPFRVGKTQWSKWHDPAREAYNRVRMQGMSHEVGVAEGNARQARGMEPEPVVEQPVEKVEVAEKPVSAPKKPRATKKST